MLALREMVLLYSYTRVFLLFTGDVILDCDTIAVMSLENDKALTWDSAPLFT